MRKFWMPVSTLAVAAALATGGCASTGDGLAQASATARPAVAIEGPITGGQRGMPYSSSIVDLADYGYTEQEYFISGTARPYSPVPGTVLGEDGRWEVTAGASLSYKTRILVRKPSAGRFNGTVVVEFMQEYFGTERDTNYRWNAETLLRQGFGWVGVSLHHEGIDDPKPPQTITYNGMQIPIGMTLARWDPERYGSLKVPSSDLSYDILSDVGRAIKNKSLATGADAFAGLNVRKLIAVGNTIAGERLSIYINAVQPKARVFDGFFLQDLGAGAQLKLSGVAAPAPVVRADVEVPVIVLNTTTAGAERGPQPEGPKLRFWVPAGSSHTTGAYMARVGRANRRDLGMDGGGCAVEANSLPVQYISGAAIVALDRWIKGGPAAPSFPQLGRFNGPKEPVPQPAPYFDDRGNVAGGLRNPWVDVPIARYDWRGDCLGGAGRTFAFFPAELTNLYGTPAAYHARFEKAVRAAEKRGTLLPEDADAAIAAARKISW